MLQMFFGGTPVSGSTLAMLFRKGFPWLCGAQHHQNIAHVLFRQIISSWQNLPFIFSSVLYTDSPENRFRTVSPLHFLHHAAGAAQKCSRLDQSHQQRWCGAFGYVSECVYLGGDYTRLSGCYRYSRPVQSAGGNDDRWEREPLHRGYIQSPYS